MATCKPRKYSNYLASKNTTDLVVLIILLAGLLIAAAFTGLLQPLLYLAIFAAFCGAIQSLLRRATISIVHVFVIGFLIWAVFSGISPIGFVALGVTAYTSWLLSSKLVKQLTYELDSKLT